MYTRYFKNSLNKISIQFTLLISIVLAMIQFIAVSFIINNILNELNIDKNEDIIKLFLAKIIIINVSMILLFIFIVLLVTKVF
jgi:uncharacterized membrane protein